MATHSQKGGNGTIAALLEDGGGTPIVPPFAEVHAPSARSLEALRLNAILTTRAGEFVMVGPGGVEFMERAGLIKHDLYVLGMSDSHRDPVESLRANPSVLKRLLGAV